ncbi:MAG: NusG domain II-containing protein [Culicoidibacterales bacterium]
MWRNILQTLKLGDYLIICSTLMIVGIWLVMNLTQEQQLLEANVLVQNQLVLTIPLSELTTTTQYEVNGANGPVIIEAQKNQVRVLQEFSPKHLCSIQGWTSNPLFPIVCLPNQTVIEIVAKGGGSNDFDSVVR